jgi:mono/diheme cytochrome c family protein
MRIVSMAVILVGVFGSGVSPVRAGQSAEPRPVSAVGPSRAVAIAEATAVIGTYCAGCHNGVMRSPSGAPLDQFDSARIADNPDIWTRAYRQLQAGTMPPVGAPRPDRPAYDTVLASIEAALGANAAPPADATSQEIADRLALFLWNSVPDASLRQDARRNRLTSPATLERQITRMLGDERARAFVARFFFPWLGLDQLGTVDPDKTYFPGYDVSLRDAMATETELFLLSQLREDRDPIELWNANYTFLNERLARHYGIPSIASARFGRVASTPERAGLLGQGSIFMAISRHQQGKDTRHTSPAARAIWVRMHFLGATPPRPFPNAQPVRPELPITPQTRALPAQPCVNCHRNFFPLGYALENFDAIGRWRTNDEAGPVDASGTFVDGTPANGVVELRAVLLRHPDAFRTTITEQLLVYASGKAVSAQRMTPDTLVRARQILHSVQPTRWSAIIAAVVRAKPRPGD